MWKHHVVHETRPHSSIIILGGHLHQVLEVAPTTIVFLTIAKQCRKVIS
jgi:hypothetical protein